MISVIYLNFYNTISDKYNWYLYILFVLTCKNYFYLTMFIYKYKKRVYIQLQIYTNIILLVFEIVSSFSWLFLI